MGQLSSPTCPLCGDDNGGRWTCESCSRTVEVFRGLIRNLQHWRSMYEAQVMAETLVDPLGRTWVLWDIERFYGYRSRLPAQMASAIEHFLYRNLLERSAAVVMGISPSNPVGVYATVGLTRLLGLARARQLPGCCFEFEADLARQPLPASLLVAV